MVERYRGKVRSKRAPERMTFTELGLKRLRVPKSGQKTYWDSGTRGQLGLSVLVSSGGTKTYRSTYYFHGRPLSRKLGRVGELDLAQARLMTLHDRRLATSGIDPARKQRGDVEFYGDVVDRFIEQYAKPKQRTWDQTERALKVNCANWLRRPIGSISKSDAYDILESLKSEGKHATAALTLTWIKKLWRWTWEREIVSSPLMDAVNIEVEIGVRDRVFDDDELKAIWNAAGSLDPVPAGFVKMAVLLVPRKTALARMRWNELDDPQNPTVWTTPFENTKSSKTSKKRIYLTPLPPLARKLFRALKRQEGTDLVFPGRGYDVPLSPTGPLVRKLVKAGAPKDFFFHALRHTAATWLENQGHSEWERGLILNHSSASVTAGYSHGYPTERKLALLTKWSDHVERVVAAGRAPLLR